MKELDVNGLKELLVQFQEKRKLDLKQFVILCVISLFIVFLVILYIVNYSSGKEVINVNSDYDSGMNLVYMIIAIVVFVSIYGFIMSRKGNGRSNIVFECNLTAQQIDERMINALKKLYYKEKVIKKENVWYAYQDNYSLNSTSKKRCLKYYVADNKIKIQAWVVLMGREFPIDTNFFGVQSKNALLYDVINIYKYLNE